MHSLLFLKSHYNRWSELPVISAQFWDILLVTNQSLYRKILDASTTKLIELVTEVSSFDIQVFGKS